MLMTVLFYAALAFLWYGAYWMARMQRLVVRHRRELAERLGEVTVTFVPEADVHEVHIGNRLLLDRQQIELLKMRPFWRRPLKGGQA